MYLKGGMGGQLNNMPKTGGGIAAPETVKGG